MPTSNHTSLNHGALLKLALRKASVTKTVTIDAGAVQSLPAVLERQFPARPALIIADDHTHAAAGQRVVAALDARGRARASAEILPGTPRLKPTLAQARRLADTLRESGAVPVAVGSGVINDLTKYAASLVPTAYVCVPTAASMDGYSASGAALLDDGFKRTFPCPPPTAIIADLDVIAAAPAAMLGWGYGDLAGKLAAGGDWILADAVGEEAIDVDVWAMVQHELPAWLAAPDALARREVKAMSGLMQGLIVSGLAMQAYGSSRPASGSDHQFSHLWEMEGLAVGGEPVSHGACVGLGCIASLALHGWLRARDFSSIDPARLAAARPPWERIESDIRAAFPAGTLAENAVAEMRAKHHPLPRVTARLERFKASWSDLQDRLRRSLPTPSRVRERLARLDAPVTPEQIGLDRPRLARDYRRARMIRRRYTIFDLLADLGCFEQAVDDLFSPSGYWGGGRTADVAPARAAAGGAAN